MDWKKHFQKDIAYHAATAHEYDAVVVDPRMCMNELLFRGIHTRIRPGSRMLDLGCGTGHAAAAFGGNFQAVVGVDHSREMLEQARSNLHSRGIHHATLIEQDLFVFLESVVTPFDLVSSVGCLHHLPPSIIPTLFKKIFNCLNKEGQFILADPITVNLSTQPDEIIEWNRTSVAAGRGFSSEADEADEAPLVYEFLCQALTDSGFEISYQCRAWEIFPRYLPATASDRESIAELHERFGGSGNVVSMLCHKPVA
ncbi:MAG: methyltransferase domain-containing protein [Gammaproteobacteria bacterium]|jgi:SAM-dependent methyltransferase|nr:methyltransferase domain-containing protein [Gammaproteobacteria bacterium]